MRAVLPVDRKKKCGEEWKREGDQRGGKDRK